MPSNSVKDIYVHKNQNLNNKERKIDYRNKDNLAGHIKRDINLSPFSLFECKVEIWQYSRTSDNRSRHWELHFICFCIVIRMFVTVTQEAHDYDNDDDDDDLCSRFMSSQHLLNFSPFSDSLLFPDSFRPHILLWSLFNFLLYFLSLSFRRLSFRALEWPETGANTCQHTIFFFSLISFLDVIHSLAVKLYFCFYFCFYPCIKASGQEMRHPLERESRHSCSCLYGFCFLSKHHISV